MTEPALNTEDIDRLGQAVMTLTKELWVIKDRQRILETVLEEAGVLDRTAIDSHVPDEKLDAALSAERKQLIDSVLGVLATPTHDAPHR